jgi:peptidoglycan hydrolase-like protein with peptidoglycan-binding domain
MVRVFRRTFLLAAIAASIVAVPAAVATSPAAAATARPANAVIQWPTIRQGTRGEVVRTIQLLLNQRGFRVGVDGVYGKATSNAVKAFQRSRKVSVDGSVGPATWPKLVITVKRGSRSDAVLAAERWLRYVYGYRSVDVDRIFGPRTEAAVKSFQSFRGLQVSGVVGNFTWQLLVLGP